MGRDDGTTSNVGPVAVLVAGEHSLFRQAIARAVHEADDLQVVAEASEVREILMQVARTSPAVVVLSDLMPDDPIETIREIRTASPDCKVLLVAASESPREVARALEAGALGYLTRQVRLSRLIEGIHTIAADEMVIEPYLLRDVVRTLVRRRNDAEAHRELLTALSPRERGILALLAEGQSSTAIAENLVISPETARTHIHNMLKKLGMHSRLEAVSFVLQNELLDELTST